MRKENIDVPTLPEENQNVTKITTENYMQVLREEIARHLENNQIAPESLAERAGVTGRTVRYIIEGKTQDVGMGNALRLFQAMYVRVYVSIG